MNTVKPTSSEEHSLEQLKHSVDEDIRKLRDAQQFRTLEEKVQDLKDQGIDPANSFDTRGDEED